MNALETLRKVYDDREAEARARQAGGQKVVGYFSANVPEELILATGAFPVRLSGSPNEATETGDLYMEDFFDGEVRSIFNRILTGHFDFVDLLVIPRTSEAMLQLYYFLHAVAPFEPKRKIPPLYLFDLLQTNNGRTGRYVRGRLEDFKHHLEKTLGAVITPKALTESITEINRNRALVMKTNALRRQGRLSGSDMLRVMGAASFMDRRRHSRLLKNISASHPSADAVRLMVKGSPLFDTAGFYELVESCGGNVVADDHSWGERNFFHSVREDIDPMAALAERYHLHSPSPRQYPQARQDGIFLQLVDDARVQGVIFVLEEHDDTLGWDYPAQRDVLHSKGIPSLLLTHQSYRHPDRVAQRVAVTGFASSIAGTAS
jgi:benzoyl-CoA reductase/2-hydroxyglutaryl-CoA dehydratase subunit BcrC/BadD/HgdB